MTEYPNLMHRIVTNYMGLASALYELVSKVQSEYNPDQKFQLYDNISEQPKIID